MNKADLVHILKDWTPSAMFIRYNIQFLVDLVRYNEHNDVYED